VIYRDDFQKAIVDYIESYREELIKSKLLQTNFIRKMDDVAQIERCFYFAYGSNLNKNQIKSRIGYVHSKYTATLKGYGFIYNKKSKDGTAKANIKQSGDELTRGICYEIDLSQFNHLKDTAEKDYQDIDVWVEIDEGKYIIAKSFSAKKEFIIADTSDTSPSQEYVKIILDGAKESQLPDDYISKYLASSLDVTKWNRG
jgi:gamma-glutamylcyclotransferase